MFNQISFIKPMPKCNMYLILFQDMIVGSIYLNSDNIITNIDINNHYLYDIMHNVMELFLFEVGLDKIELECDKTLTKFYKQLGFKKFHTASNDRYILVYINEKIR